MSVQLDSAIHLLKMIVLFFQLWLNKPCTKHLPRPRPTMRYVTTLLSLLLALHNPHACEVPHAAGHEGGPWRRQRADASAGFLAGFREISRESTAADSRLAAASAPLSILSDCRQPDCKRVFGSPAAWLQQTCKSAGRPALLLRGGGSTYPPWTTCTDMEKRRREDGAYPPLLSEMCRRHVGGGQHMRSIDCGAERADTGPQSGTLRSDRELELMDLPEVR